jgi:acetyl-CoA C-acetyltransferase
MAERCAVIGVGQTHHKAKREDVSIAGLVREAAKMALADAELTWTDIDAVVIGKAPDMFEGNMMPELYLAPALGAVGKPMFRVHTAGSVGGSTALVAAHLISSGIHKRVLTVAYEKQSDSDAMWALSVPQPFAAPLLAGAGGYFAPHIRAYMRRSGAPDHIGRMVAVKDRLNALRNPYAHLHLADIDMKMVEESMMLGPAAVSRGVPLLGRRRRHGPVVGGLGVRPLPAGMGPRHGHAIRADHVRRSRPSQPPGRTGLLRRRLRPGGNHRPP